jgi:hypothetical protein
MLPLQAVVVPGLPDGKEILFKRTPWGFVPAPSATTAAAVGGKAAPATAAATAVASALKVAQEATVEVTIVSRMPLTTVSDANLVAAAITQAVNAINSAAKAATAAAAAAAAQAELENQLRAATARVNDLEAVAAAAASSCS